MSNNYYITYIYYIILINLFILCGYSLPAQDKQEIQLANEYLSKGDKEKALTTYEQLAKKNENIPFIHNSFLNLLLDLQKYSQAEDYVEKLIRKDNKLSYKLDLGIVYHKSGNITKADKYLTSIIKSMGDDAYQLKTTSDYLASKNLSQFAILALQQTRNTNKNSGLYALELANLYRMSGQRDLMVEEYLNYVIQTPSNISYIKNVMQILITKPEELESLERLLIDRVQRNQNSEVYSDLIIWVNLQQKNFYGAFIQARAYDRRFRKENSKTLEIGYIAFNNQDYDNADKCFSFVIKEFAGTENELPARLGVIKSREAKVKKSYPVNRDSVRYLVNEYKVFRRNYPDNSNTFEAILNQAMLHAYYLDEKDSAVMYLQSIISSNKVTPSLKAKAKMDLGDIYLLKDEPWEATLLYSQVEKSQRESPLGYEAKLKNAKLSYYKGDFKLAQEHLDILKQATTREIANDAMELSMLIKENTTFDTTGAALQEYAIIELLVAQNKTEVALQRLSNFKIARKIKMSRQEAISSGLWNPESKLSVTDLIRLKKDIEMQKESMLNTTSDSVWVDVLFEPETTTLKDNIYWLEASLRLKKGEFETALLLYQKIVNDFGDDILADDAFFAQGEIYERYLHNKEKAMEIYREFLTRYPGSVFVAEARKRFRTLRGDFAESIDLN